MDCPHLSKRKAKIKKKEKKRVKKKFKGKWEWKKNLDAKTKHTSTYTETQTYSSVTKTVKQIIYGWTCKFSYVQMKQQQKLACDERIKAKRKTRDRKTESKKKIKPKRFLCVAPAAAAAKAISRTVGNDAELFIRFFIWFVTCLQNAMNNLFNKLSKIYIYTRIYQKSKVESGQTRHTVSHTHTRHNIKIQKSPDWFLVACCVAIQRLFWFVAWFELYIEQKSKNESKVCQNGEPSTINAYQRLIVSLNRSMLE